MTKSQLRKNSRPIKIKMKQSFILSTFLLLAIFVICWHQYYRINAAALGSNSDLNSGRSMLSATANDISGNQTPCALDAVVLTTGKDSLVFERSIASCLKHLLDVRTYYVITPNVDALQKKYGTKYGNRVKFVGEAGFPFNGANISEVMYQSVKDAGKYPLDGKTPFEGAMYGKIGWFLQQLLKLYAGRVLNLGDYILLDSDLVWFQDVRFLASCNATSRSYYYASSCQYHPSYMNTLGPISGVGPVESKVHRSGIVHHMVLVKHVLEGLFRDSEKRHNGMPFWNVLVNVSAREMTCRAPRLAICGAGSTLSEYELYFNYARAKFPETVTLRPLFWTNGPSPGLLFWPQPANVLKSDGGKSQWMHHRQWQVPEILDKQMAADREQGYHFVGYHAYAKRRYSEMVGVDLNFLCANVSEPRNSTCSWREYEEYETEWRKNHSIPAPKEEKKGGEGEFTKIAAPGMRNISDYFQGCACWMARHQSGP